MELTPSARSIGKWFVRVCATSVEEFQYGKSPKKDGKAFRCLLVSPDAALYCHGVAELMSPTENAKKDFQAIQQKFETGKVFEMTKVSFDDKHDKTWNSASVKIVVALSKTTMTAVVQNMLVMPSWPAPDQDLSSLLEVPQRQSCDVTVFVKAIENERRCPTKSGDRNIVDVTIIDGSKTSDGKTAQTTFPLFSARPPEVTLTWTY